jgi:hypothetical protein
MHKKGACAKKCIKISPNLGAKSMFFLRTRRTLPKTQKNAQKWQSLLGPEMDIFSFYNMHFFIPTSHNISHKHI